MQTQISPFLIGVFTVCCFNCDLSVCINIMSVTAVCMYVQTLGAFNPSLAEHDMPCPSKQCRSRSVGFWRSQLIWISTVCHQVCEFIATIQIKHSDWLKIRSRRGILIYSAWEGLRWYADAFNYVCYCIFHFLSFFFSSSSSSFLCV